MASKKNSLKILTHDGPIGGWSEIAAIQFEAFGAALAYLQSLSHERLYKLSTFDKEEHDALVATTKKLKYPGLEILEVNDDGDALTFCTKTVVGTASDVYRLEFIAFIQEIVQGSDEFPRTEEELAAKLAQRFGLHRTNLAAKRREQREVRASRTFTGDASAPTKGGAPTSVPATVGKAGGNAADSLSASPLAELKAFAKSHSRGGVRILVSHRKTLGAPTIRVHVRTSTKRESFSAVTAEHARTMIARLAQRNKVPTGAPTSHSPGV